MRWRAGARDMGQSTGGGDGSETSGIGANIISGLRYKEERDTMHGDRILYRPRYDSHSYPSVFVTFDVDIFDNAISRFRGDMN